MGVWESGEAREAEGGAGRRAEGGGREGKVPHWWLGWAGRGWCGKLICVGPTERVGS